jgi:hypothetical protein
MHPDNMWVPQRRGQVGLAVEPFTEVGVSSHRLDGCFEQVRTAFALVKCGADDGNRTRVFSLGSRFGASRRVRVRLKNVAACGIPSV